MPKVIIPHITGGGQIRHYGSLFNNEDSSYFGDGPTDDANALRQTHRSRREDQNRVISIFMLGELESWFDKKRIVIHPNRRGLLDYYRPLAKAADYAYANQDEEWAKSEDWFMITKSVASFCVRHMRPDNYRNSDHWKAIRAYMLEHVYDVCEVCENPDSLAIHHASYANVGYETPKDLQILCNLCHSKAHRPSMARAW